MLMLCLCAFVACNKLTTCLLYELFRVNHTYNSLVTTVVQVVDREDREPGIEIESQEMPLDKRVPPITPGNPGRKV